MAENRRKLILEDGSVYDGMGFGAEETRVCEVVFNTSMVGYQEILTDPSYTHQAVVMTYPLIGNYGLNGEDNETEVPTIGALIVGECCDTPSNFRSGTTLSDWCRAKGIPGLFGVDTRRLTRSLRDFGSRRGALCPADTTVEEGLALLAAHPERHDAVPLVSTKTARTFSTAQPRFHVVAVDCGIKHNILRSLCRRGCRVTLVPYDTPAEEIRKLSPDGLFLSNGPGDPQDVRPVISLVQNLRGELPIFGICLGHQMIALAYGAKTYKLKFGHRGGNHPVKNLLTGKVEITSQNHSYAVDAASLARTGLTLTHVNLLDGTVEGMCCAEDHVFSVQYHPESAPGPEDSAYLFDEFLNQMEGYVCRREQI